MYRREFDKHDWSVSTYLTGGKLKWCRRDEPVTTLGDPAPRPLNNAINTVRAYANVEKCVVYRDGTKFAVVRETDDREVTVSYEHDHHE